MPCNQVRLYRTKLEAADLQILKKALESEFAMEIYIDAQHVIRPENSQRAGWQYIQDDLIFSTDTTVGDRIKRAYSREVVKVAAAKYRWSLKSVSAKKMLVTRY